MKAEHGRARGAYPFNRRPRPIPHTTEIAPPLPHNADAERSVLGAILLDKDALPAVREILNTEDFFAASISTFTRT
jgi:hypothetical protein